MNESILTSVKKMLGIEEDYTHFDPDLIIHINTAFNVLAQLGVGPLSGYQITDKSNSWGELGLDNMRVQMLKTYCYLKTRMVFDPPSTGIVADVFKDQIAELEWRLNVAVDPEVEV